jgi:hypothetical protein
MEGNVMTDPRITEIAADLAAAATFGRPEEFAQLNAEVQERYPLEIKQQIYARLADTTPNPND